MKRFEEKCGSDVRCVLKEKFMIEIVKEMRTDIENAVRPQGPIDPTEWLSNEDIELIMKPYQQVFPDYKFLGAVPLDCDEVKSCAINAFSLNSLGRLESSNSKRIGIIYNHDRSGMPGSHWVSLFMDLRNNKIGFIYYCDSAGAAPKENIISMIDIFKSYCAKTNRKCIYEYNTNGYQLDSSECGVYSCNFQIRLLNEETFADVVNDYLDFKGINSCRNTYFSNAPSEFEINDKCDPGRAQLLY